MSKFQQIISEYNEKLKYDVEIDRYVKLFDLNEFNNIIKLCNDNDIKVFSQKFTLTSKIKQPNTLTYRIYDSIDIFGNNCCYYNHNQGSEFYKIYDYYEELKFMKKSRRSRTIRNLKLYKIKRVRKITKDMMYSYFKLDKGLN